MDSLSYLWSNESGDAEPRGQGMSSRTFRPVAGAFEGNWLGHGAVPEALDIEGVPREYGGWNDFVSRVLMLLVRLRAYPLLYAGRAAQIKSPVVAFVLVR